MPDLPVRDDSTALSVNQCCVPKDSLCPPQSMGEQCACNDSKVKGLDRLGQPLEVLRQAPEAVHPHQAAFGHPSPRQQLETAPGLQQFHGLQRGPVVVGVILDQFHGLAS